jgi:hypothetical protein
MGIKPKKTLCREGSTIGDCQNLYLWFSEEKTEEELKIIYQCILQTIEENSSIPDDTQTIELGGDIEMDQLV